eukprot:TRINITY_DN26539_c0_g1_i1.p1 TRINITY_DN26539_c0_g1~~TRINITY_DN26539_c0_g1_i1.p1  ORF type:complete len:192 (+),score=40.75 TRINITY_DN26539_c0_g1_i1:67-576(+)
MEEFRSAMQIDGEDDQEESKAKKKKTNKFIKKAKERKEYEERQSRLLEQEYEVVSPLKTKSDLDLKFRDFYIGQLTKAFGDELNEVREEVVKVGHEARQKAAFENLLASLEAGTNLFTDVEKELSLQYSKEQEKKERKEMAKSKKQKIPCEIFCRNQDDSHVIHGRLSQ